MTWEEVPVRRCVCLTHRKDVKAHWLWLRKEVELKSDWIRRLAATPTPPPQPPPARCNGLAPPPRSEDGYEMSSIEPADDMGRCHYCVLTGETVVVHSVCVLPHPPPPPPPAPPPEVGRSIPVLPPYAGHPLRPGVEREERPNSLTTASDSETDTYISRGTGQSHFSRVGEGRQWRGGREEGGRKGVGVQLSGSREV